MSAKKRRSQLSEAEQASQDARNGHPVSFAQLFEEADFKVPSEDPSIPFEPGRTIEVSRARWHYYSNPASRKPSKGLLARAARTCFPYRLRHAAAATAGSERSIFGLPVLAPESVWVAVWSLIITVVDLTYTSFLVPISIAFDEIYPGTSWTWLTIMDCVGTAFFIADMLLEFHTGFIVKYDIHRLVIRSGTDVARRYVYHLGLNGFWVDLAAVLAIIPEILASLLHGVSGGGYKAFYLFRLLRLLRVARMLREASIDLMTTVDPARYLASIYFAITVLTTVGFGDISPSTLPEMALAGVYMLCSLFYFGYIVNVVGALLTEVSSSASSASALRRKLEEIEQWLTERSIPPDLQQAVRRYFYELWAPLGGGIHDADYFLELPVVLRGRIVAKVAGEAIRKSRMLGVLSPEIQAHLSEGALPRRLLAGHNLCEEGGAADRFWVLQEGEVRFYRSMHATGEVHAPAVLGQAAIFGPWIEDCRERMHTVRGVTSCSLWEFDSRPLQRLAKHNPDVLRVLCESYLHYLHDVEQRWAASVAQVGRLPKRVPRIKAQVEHMLKKAKRKILKEEESGETEIHMEPRSESEASDTAVDMDFDRQASIDARAPSRHEAQMEQHAGQHPAPVPLNNGRSKGAMRPSLYRESDEAVLEDEQLIGSMEEGGVER